ncbi:MAG: peptidase M19 [Bacteroidetes bacterium 24-39-8]|jgi:membrane dipeptidase|nr:MAG: peptidase M19 [Sphingobacteriia bacterium 35-40-8]OYZ50309.1 MAG: peptidase M19 [Bacteroidetes bacterium 24-39-8]OZA66842.1 MAG: peptidase M19 [Sphingobacteriia bacterium 39-39-8]HQR92954.1 membrane dipeptidase [Sediminibacterium sp.]HQS53922.1 membrane dipeptidase [Sediminibacterium sp.]
MLLIDAHLDLAMNAMEWNRNLQLSVHQIRDSEMGMTDKPDRGKGTVSLPALREGNIGLVVATQIARYVGPGSTLKGWHSPEQAWAQTQGQLAWYKAMEAAGEMRQIKDQQALEEHLSYWNQDPNHTNKAIGYVLSLEGADSLITLDHLHIAHGNGLRAVGPGHYGPGRYANGTDATGHLNEMGRNLLKEMLGLNMILDATHLCDDAFWDAMEIYDGTIWASHNNCRALVNHNRQFSDEMIKTLIQKGAVIGGALDAWMMVPNWQRGVSTPESTNCTLEIMIDHLDHICQLAGNTRHVGIGTDLDGAYGKEQCPYDLDTIADMQQLENRLLKRGYTQSDLENIFHSNWLRCLRKSLPLS